MDRFLLKLLAKRMYRDEEDMVIWTVLKNGKFSVKFIYFALEPDDPLLLPRSII